MGKNTPAERMVLSFPSDLKYLGAVDAAVQDLAREFLFSTDDINDVSTALIEACSNAIEHGNRFSPEKRVDVTLVFNGTTFTALVKDQGNGFDFEKALREEQPTDPLSERGRGLMIMRAFTDGLKFTFSTNGLLVELTKRRAPDGGDPSE